MNEPVRLGVVGYGAGGRLFHTPFVAAADGIELVGIVARSPARISEARQDWPDVPVHDSLEKMLVSGVDAVTITTPPQTHVDLAHEALDAGVHVVVDKPFAPTVHEAQGLIEHAAKAGVLLSVYQNRRWDSDIVSFAEVLRAGELGEIWRIVSRMDQDNFASVHAGPGNGLLLDLGTHLIDQMVWLLGPVDAVDARLHWVDLPEGRTEAAFALTLHHRSGVTSDIESTKAHRLAVRELRVLGSTGAYQSQGTDAQERAIKTGLRPTADDPLWGYEPPEAWGRLVTSHDDRTVPSSQGRWQDFYTQFATAVRDGTGVPVPPADALHVLAIIEAAKASDATGRTATVSQPRASAETTSHRSGLVGRAADPRHGHVRA